jgi:hypothetical protein
MIAIYPPQRAVEHAVAIPGNQPVRLFALLWPLWQIEVTGFGLQAQAYETLDHALVRAIADARIVTMTELAEFFALDKPLVRRVLEFLASIGHVTESSGTLTLTPLGRMSLDAGVRYVNTEFQQVLLFDRFSMNPMPLEYYGREIVLLNTPTLSNHVRFTALFSARPFRTEAIEELMSGPNRGQFNLPAEVDGLRNLFVEPGEAYLPVYVIETAAGELLAYSKVHGNRDAFIESRCSSESTIKQIVQAEPRLDAEQTWRDWLAGHELPASDLRQLPNGVWQVCLPGGAFEGTDAVFDLAKLGSFQLFHRLFLRLWCTDEEVRYRALLQQCVQTLQQLATPEEAQATFRNLADRLEVPPLSLDELRKLAEQGDLIA